MMPRKAAFRGGGSLSARTRIVVLGALVCAVLGHLASAAAGAEVKTVRFWTSNASTRVVLDLSEPVAYRYRQLSHPERIVLDLPGAYFAGTGPVVVGDGVIRRIRRNVRDDGAQLVMDLAAAFDARHFALSAEAGRPDRIVIDVFVRAPDPAPRAPSATQPDTARWTVVIDPGHGGLDPGAIHRGVREKDVVLDLARQLAERLEARADVRAILTREGDYFLSLSERVQMAERAGGDLFVSIHANAHTDAAATGLEAYTLTLADASDGEAQALADKENAADRVGLAPGEERDDVLSILMDLRVNRIQARANRLARQLVGAARRLGPVTGRKVRQAGFHVLRSVDMPSVLVEAAYLSNSRDRALLASREGRGRLAGTMATGIIEYLSDVHEIADPPPAGWARSYRVRPGDTLWRLARRHDTTVAEIRDRNALASDRLAVGQVLKLP